MENGVKKLNVGVLLWRMGIFGVLGAGVAYSPVYNSGYGSGQVDGYRKGYVQCEVAMKGRIERMIDRSYASLKSSCDRLNELYADTKGWMEELEKEKGQLKQTTTLTEQEILNALKAIKEQEKR